MAALAQRLLAVAIALAVIAAVLLLAAYLAPRVLPNLFTQVSDDAETQTVTDAGASATIVVPPGWASQRAWGSESELVLRSPDGGFVVTLTVSTRAPAETISSGDSRGAAIPVVEQLASGLAVAHAQTDDALVVAVGRASSAPSLQMRVKGTPEELAPYRPALAGLVESARVRR